MPREQVRRLGAGRSPLHRPGVDDPADLDRAVRRVDPVEAGQPARDPLAPAGTTANVRWSRSAAPCATTVRSPRPCPAGRGRAGRSRGRRSRPHRATRRAAARGRPPTARAGRTGPRARPAAAGRAAIQPATGCADGLAVRVGPRHRSSWWSGGSPHRTGSPHPPPPGARPDDDAAPTPAAQLLGDRVDAGGDLGERGRERGQPDPQAAGVAVVGDHVAPPQRRDDLLHRRMAQRDVAAAALRVARRGDLDAERGQPLVGQRRRRTTSGRPTSPGSRRCPTSASSASMSRSGSMPRTGGVPERKRRTPSTGVYVGPIRNGSVAPIQPWIGWVRLVEVPRGDVDVRRRARDRR